MSSKSSPFPKLPLKHLCHVHFDQPVTYKNNINEGGTSYVDDCKQWQITVTLNRITEDGFLV